MEDRTRLDDWFAAARDDLSARVPDPMQEQQLLSRVREVRALQSVAQARGEPDAHRARRASDVRPFFRWFFAPVFALALVIVLGFAVLMSAPQGPDGSTSMSSTSMRRPFLALVTSEAIAAEPSAVIVSSRVSSATLADYGLPLDPARADRLIGAEFLMSPTGTVLAVRFTE